MIKISEYQIEINNDEDLKKWKSTWDGQSVPPESVLNYVRQHILSKILADMENLLILPNN